MLLVIGIMHIIHPGLEISFRVISISECLIKFSSYLLIQILGRFHFSLHHTRDWWISLSLSNTHTFLVSIFSFETDKRSAGVIYTILKVVMTFLFWPLADIKELEEVLLRVQLLAP